MRSKLLILIKMSHFEGDGDKVLAVSGPGINQGSVGQKEGGLGGAALVITNIPSLQAGRLQVTWWGRIKIVISVDITMTK